MPEGFNISWDRVGRNRAGGRRDGITLYETEHQEACGSPDQSAVAEVFPKEGELVEDDLVAEEDMSLHDRVVYYASFLEHVVAMSRMYHPRALRSKSHQPYEEDVVLEEVAIGEQQELPPGNDGVRRKFVRFDTVYFGFCAPQTLSACSREPSHQPYEEDVVLVEVAIGEQQELPPGNDGVRRKFVMHSSPSQSPVPTPMKLAECFENNVLDMLRAAMFINRNRFSSHATYKDFVQAAAASSITRYSYDGFEGIADFETYRTLNTIASQFFADIITAKMKPPDKKGTNMTQMLSAQCSRRQKFSIVNCVQQWLLLAEEPFREGLDLRSTVQRWFPNLSHSVSVQAVSMFRFLLQKLTDPPPAIQSYAVRESRKAGRDRNLKSLPEDVESFLIEFALDMLGYGRDEMKCPARVQLDESRYFTLLGKTFEERHAALMNLVDQREEYKKQMNRALQLALRDIRNYTYGEVNGVRQWIKNKRQSRAEEQADDDDADALAH
ncbi:unnamed protein product [Nippostrongylus brasiliensis]|uniref:Ras-GAP domain-containing protein n=1 Tax=Nippostrongylus brasiliensis TaxID=27835 RepID=A0A0N4YUW4_NIPBR|nr:unnamed protein product [Nippostrongylus brasiliensis]